MNQQELLNQIAFAFADATWPHDGPPEEIDIQNALQIADDLFLRYDETVKYELSKLMSLVVGAGEHLDKRVLCKLIDFVDVEFDDQEGTNDPLKSAKLFS
jgi:hypothetical protein